MRRSEFLIVYDICEPSRLRQVARVMETYGIRVQKSVFECRLSSRSLTELRKRLLNLLVLVEDSVRIYPLLGGAREKQSVLGVGTAAPLTEAVV